MMTFSFDTREIMKNLSNMPEGIKTKLLDSAVRQGANVVLQEVRRTTPKRSGGLIKAARIKKLRTRAQNLMSIFEVGHRRPGGSHAHLIEFGHKIYKRVSQKSAGITGKDGRKYAPTGRRTQSKPVLKSAFFRSQRKILAAVAKELSVEKIEKRVLKIATRKRRK